MKTEWNLDILNKDNFEDKRKVIKKAFSGFINKWKENKEYLEKPEVLRKALDEYEELNKSYFDGGDEYYFYWLKTQLNQSDPELRAKFNKAEEFAKDNINDISFFTINLSKIPKEKQKIMILNEHLREYKHFLEGVFSKGKYTLTEKEEKIINLKSCGAYSFWVDMLAGFLSKEEEIVLDENNKESKKNYSEISSLTHSQDKKIRQRSIEAFNRIIEKYEDVAENEINAVLENKKINDKLRGYERPDKSRHIADDIESEIVDSLIESVSKKGFEISRRYYKLKLKLLGMSKFNYSERNIEYGEISKDFNFENSSKIIKRVFENLDKRFKDILEEFLKNGKIDAFPKKGKRSGAFCVIQLKTQPVYVMLNHTGKLRDITIFAHEMGHAINDEFMKKNLNALNIGNPKSIAEVASTFMEDFVLDELLKEANDEERLIILMQKLQEDIQTIIRQIACYKFEQQLHKEFREKGYLSKEDIGKIFSENMQNYLGDSFEKGKDMENGWIYWPHIREYFYVYSYSSGLLISKAMQKLVRENPKNIDKVKEFLSSGTSDSPKNVFMKMGIDITKKEFWEKGLDEIEELLMKTEKLGKRLGKI